MLNILFVVIPIMTDHNVLVHGCGYRQFQIQDLYFESRLACLSDCHQKAFSEAGMMKASR